MNKFILNGGYGELLKFYGIHIEEVLRKASLPANIFNQSIPVMKEEEYFKFMDTIGGYITDSTLPIQIACTENIERFTPPIFAAYYSKNGRVCIERLAKYKSLIGPMLFSIKKGDVITEVELVTESGAYGLPQFLVETEFIFLVNILCKASKERVVPYTVKM